ncbi:class C sortase [Arcanobacterium buesumense]|uniref:class C sortase n=1 Tax=Arcanobacterium buesumense TaxID=2722751 RepID=UPI001FFDBABA|nr:class C sortase [Arcanobacterium buesumense]
MMGRIIVDKADLDLPIYHGATTQNLLKGSAHLEGTSLPIGGIGTRTVIIGHRGLASAEMFTHLDRLEEGDLFSINILGRVYSYKVIDIQVVSPEESDSIRPVEGKDLATLITCKPLGINSHRILVTGERVDPTPAVEEGRATSASYLPRFPWLLLGGAVLILMSLGSITHSAIGIWKEKKKQ